MLALVVFTFIFMWLPYNLYFIFLQPIVQVLTNFLKLVLITLLGSNGFSNHFARLYEHLLSWHVILSPKSSHLLFYEWKVLLSQKIWIFLLIFLRFRLGFRYAFRWLPYVRVRKEDYEIVFSAGSRVSYPTNSRFSVANTVFSSHNGSQQQKCSVQHNNPISI